MEAVLAVSAALGACVGLILGLTGAGGAIMAVPLLVFGLHLQVAQAAPIALLAVGLAAALGAALGLRAGRCATARRVSSRPPASWCRRWACGPRDGCRTRRWP